MANNKKNLKWYTDCRSLYNYYQESELFKKVLVNKFVKHKKPKSDLLFKKGLNVGPEFSEEGSRDLFDIIKFCCAIKENPTSPNLKQWSRNEYNLNLNSLVYDNSVVEDAGYDEQTNKMLSYAQRAQIYAMTAITALNSGDGEKAVWNAVRSQKYVSHIQEMIQLSSPGMDGRQRRQENMQTQSLGVDDVKANDLIDEFEKLIQVHDSYGAFRRLAAKRLGVPAIKVTIKEINEITKQVHKAYEFNPKRRRTEKI